MRIGLIIADFDSHFTTSFKHTARVKYNVDFTNSNVGNITENLKTLHHNMQTGNVNAVHVGYDFSLQDVEHIQQLLHTIIRSYTEYFYAPPPPGKKIYDLMRQVREAATPTPEQTAKQIVKDIITPPTNDKKQSKKEKTEEAAKVLSKERALKLLQRKK